jgi:hypothetical protein
MWMESESMSAGVIALWRLCAVAAAMLAALPAWASESGGAAQRGPAPSRGHAHNDYEHERPLFDALDHGFVSVEADIHLVNGELLVAHDREDVRPGRTLEALYLDPLRNILTERDAVQPGAGRFILLIDIKSEAESTYAELSRRLEPYRGMLARVKDGELVPGPVWAILSGNRPIDTVAARADRLVFIDGRLDDLGEGVPATLMPLVSSHWFVLSRWTGLGEMPEEDRAELRRVAGRAAAEGKLLRFWATPHREALWDALVAAGVPLINADDLARLEAYLRAGSAGAEDTTRD